MKKPSVIGIITGMIAGAAFILAIQAFFAMIFMTALTIVTEWESTISLYYKVFILTNMVVIFKIYWRFINRVIFNEVKGVDKQ